MEDILSLTYEELESILKEQNQPKFRAGQLFYDLHNGKHINDITTIPQTLKQYFNDNYITKLVEIIKVISDIVRAQVLCILQWLYMQMGERQKQN